MGRRETNTIYGHLRSRLRNNGHVTEISSAVYIVCSNRRVERQHKVHPRTMEEGGADAAIRKNLLDRVLNSVKQVRYC